MNVEKKEPFTEPVSFRDTKRIVTMVDEIAAARGGDRSALYRLGIRFLLATMGLLPQEEARKILLNLPQTHN